ncbi:hypothetical protein M3B69_01315 [Raoultella ornithinolytica]|uniref:hypothetical protein n=1 Tax=Raoultella ornithinolytica TaxID=54291 RepID=UPI0021A6BC5D|nr:hypothetical protein [Raoultella ornithinolytica]MCT1678576.1 hypothetical protein [Raoultella ornithinolytica]
MKITAESILTILRKDERNNITAFHRWQTAQGALGHTAGITLNYHEPYYEGWAPALEMCEVSISAPELQQVIPFLSVEHWGDGLIGGEIYRIPREEE